MTGIESPPCSCPMAGYCQRLQRRMPKRLHYLCQSNPAYRLTWERQLQGLPPLAAPKQPEPPPRSYGLGDRVEQALNMVGITKERVEHWMGQPCKCPERQEKLNQLGRWASRIISGKVDKAKEYLEGLISG